MSPNEKIAALCLIFLVLILVVSNIVLLILLNRSKRGKEELNEQFKYRAYVDKKVFDTACLDRRINNTIDHRLIVAFVRVLIRHYFIQGYEINLISAPDDIPKIENLISNWVSDTKDKLKKVEIHE